MQVSILMVRALIGMIERSGASRERFLSLAGIDPAAIEAGTLRIPVLDYVCAIDVALEVSGDPAFGLHMGENARSTMFDVVGPLAEQATTLRNSVANMERYSRLLAEGYSPELRETGETAAIHFPSLRGDFAAVRLTAEFAMTGLSSALELFAGAHARPQEVRFAYPQPAYASEYRRIFGGAERFSCEHTEMILPRAWLDRAQIYRNPALYAVLEEQAERNLGRLERDSSLLERIERILAKQDAVALTMDDVARGLGMSARSLRRHLQADGVSFADLATRARMNAAKRMLQRPGASIQETAFAMGFASPAAFHRAFKRWTGMTPRQYQDAF